MFPLSDGLLCHRVSYSCHPTLLYVLETPRLYLYIVDLGAICSSKLSLLLHPPCILSTPLFQIYLTCSLPPAPFCVPRPLELPADLVLTVHCPPLSLLKAPG